MKSVVAAPIGRMSPNFHYLYIPLVGGDPTYVAYCESRSARDEGHTARNAHAFPGLTTDQFCLSTGLTRR
jgi:hypothetical protein